MKIYSGPYHLSGATWKKKKKNVSAASLDTHIEQCLQNPLIYQYVYVHSAKWQSILSLSLLILFFRPLFSNCHLASEKKAAIIALQ